MATGTFRTALETGGDSPFCLSSMGCPRVARSAIQRPRVTAELSEPDWRLAVVTGGTATGKTVAIAQWYATLRETVSEWVTFRGSDDQPARWWAALAAALNRAAPGSFAHTSAVAAGGRSSEEMVDAVLIELAMLETECVLVFDDVHLLRNAEIWSAVWQLIERMPVNAHLVITSRCDPPIPRALWSARGWLREIRQSDLAFSLSETSQYLEQLREPTLTPVEVEEIWRRSEGWVACLTILATQIRRGGRVSEVLNRFSGGHPMIADLLMDQVVDEQADEIADFMVRTSILSELDPELCDAVTGREDSREILRLLEATVPFVTQGDAAETYRYHPLLSEALRRRLEVRVPGASTELARVAAESCKHRGDDVSAVGYLIASGNHEEAFSAALGAALDRCDHGDVGAAAAWVDLIRPDLAAESVPLMLTRAVGLSIIGRAEESLAWTDRAEMRVEQAAQDFPRERAVADALRLHAFVTSTGTGDGVEPGRRALAASDRGLDIGDSCRVRPDMARAYLLVDQPEAAVRVLETQVDGDEFARLIDIPGLQARAFAGMGELAEALDLAAGALVAVRTMGAEGHLGELDVRLAEASLLAERNQIGEADVSLKHLRSSAEAHPGALVYRVLSLLAEIRLAVLHGGPEEGLAIIEETRALLGVRRRPLLTAMIDAAAARWNLEAGLDQIAETLLSMLPADHRQHGLLCARLDLVRGRPYACLEKLKGLAVPDRRRQLERELLRVRAAIALNDPAVDDHVKAAVSLAAPQQILLTILEEGPVVTRLVRAAADQVETPQAVALAHALGAPPKARSIDHGDSLLSDRERTVLRFLPTRLTNREIAQECCMSVNTVKTHVKHIYEKLGVSTRAAAGDRARTLGLLSGSG